MCTSSVLPVPGRPGVIADAVDGLTERPGAGDATRIVVIEPVIGRAITRCHVHWIRCKAHRACGGPRTIGSRVLRRDDGAAPKQEGKERTNKQGRKESVHELLLVVWAR